MTDRMDRDIPFYDRDFLLSPGKRNQFVALWEVKKFGTDSFGDPDHVRLYGMTPDEWWRRGVRLLARTTLEAVPDALGAGIGRDVAAVLGRRADTSITVIDPFAGSCNGLYWLLRHLPRAEGVGFELDPTIFDLTRRNLALLDRRVTLLNGDFRSLLPSLAVAAGRLVVLFVAPPWGDALDPVRGLDLGRTKPPVAAVVECCESALAPRPILYVTQIHEHLVPEPLADYRSGFAWSDLRIYDLGPAGMRHGIILGAARWQPGG
jgi:hypothetical protein